MTWGSAADGDCPTAVDLKLRRCSSIALALMLPRAATENAPAGEEEHGRRSDALISRGSLE